LEEAHQQSWSRVVYSGELILAVGRRGRASLRLVFDQRTTGGDYDGHAYDSREHARCEWDGYGRWRGDELVLSLRYPKPRDASSRPFACRSRRLGADEAGFELRCRHALLAVEEGSVERTRDVRVLRCTLDGSQPVMLALLSAPREASSALSLGDGSLRVVVSDDDGPPRLQLRLETDRHHR
jgi:hypothetical protein